jgi:phosphohistidine phosphatase
MKIYLLRHAIAELRKPDKSDRDRRLTAEGRKELLLVARSLARMKLRPDTILSSPYARAWDTARVVAAELRPGGKPEECQALMPSGNPARVWSELRRHHAAKAVLMVGHEPLLSEFAAFLLNAPHATLHLKKCGLIRIDLHTVQVERPAGTLRWLLTAKQLARMK